MISRRKRLWAALPLLALAAALPLRAEEPAATMPAPLEAPKPDAAPAPVTPAWDRVATIKDAAQRIAVLHRTRGPKAAYQFIDACYRTQSLASNYGEGFETCLVQDYLETNMLMQISARTPPEALKQIGAATPAELSEGVARRFAGALRQYNLPVSHADELKKLVDQHGAPVYLAVMFPEAARAAEEKKAKGESAPGKDDPKSPDEKREK